MNFFLMDSLEHIIKIIKLDFHKKSCWLKIKKAIKLVLKENLTWNMALFDYAYLHQRWLPPGNSHFKSEPFFIFCDGYSPCCRFHVDRNQIKILDNRHNNVWLIVGQFWFYHDSNYWMLSDVQLSPMKLFIQNVYSQQNLIKCTIKM